MVAHDRWTCGWRFEAIATLLLLSTDIDTHALIA